MRYSIGDKYVYAIVSSLSIKKPHKLHNYIPASFCFRVNFCSGSSCIKSMNSVTAELMFWGCNINTSPALCLQGGRNGGAWRREGDVEIRE